MFRQNEISHALRTILVMNHKRKLLFYLSSFRFFHLLYAEILFLFRCLKIVYRFQHRDNLHCISQNMQNILQRLIRHGRLIQSLLIDRARVNPLHAFPIFFHAEFLLRLSSGHNPSCPMRCGIIPFRISLSKIGIRTFSPACAAIAPFRSILSPESI